MMKTYRRLFIVAVSALAIAACGNLDELKERVDNIDGRVTALEKVSETINSNIAALQAIASGQAINKVEEKDGAYVLTLSNGTVLTLQSGSVGMGKAPLMSIDKDGYWMVDYQDGNGAVYITDDNGEKIVAVGQNGVTPQFGVSDDGFWTVSYNGGGSFSPVIDVNGNRVKAVAGSSAEDSYFAGVEYRDESLVLTLKNGEQYSVPVVGGFLFKINGAADEEVFRKGEKKTFSVEQKGIATTVISAPKGWEAYLTNTVLSIQAPSEPETKADVLADTRTDVAVIAISEAGHIAIAKVHVKVDGSISVYDPAASVALVEATSNSLKFNVTTENATSWYYMLRKSGEAAPGAAELISDGTKGTDAAVLVEGLLGQTDYVFYVLPCGDASNGPVTAFKARTADYASMYEAWEAGAEITIGSQTYSKEKNGKGVLVTGNRSQQVWGDWFTSGKDAAIGALFIDEGSSAFIKNAGYNKPMVIVGNKPGTRPEVRVDDQINVTSDLAFRNISLNLAAEVNKLFIYTNTAMGKVIFEDCYIDMKYPVLRRHSSSVMEGIEILDSDVCVDWNCDTPFFLNTHAGGAECGDLIVKNNVFWSKDGKKEFHIIAGPWIKDTKFNKVVLENNTFYNVNCGQILSTSRQRAMIVTSTVESFSMNGNIAYDTAPDSKKVGTRPHFTWLYASQMGIEDLKAASSSTTSSLVNIAEYCGLLVSGTNQVDWGWGITNLIQWKEGSSNSEIESWENPFQSEDAANGVFKTKDSYKEYGAQR